MSLTISLTLSPENLFSFPFFSFVPFFLFRFSSLLQLHYWATGDYEWYDPDAATTEDGNLVSSSSGFPPTDFESDPHLASQVLTITQEPIHDLNFRSGMLQS